MTEVRDEETRGTQGEETHEPDGAATQTSAVEATGRPQTAVELDVEE